MIAELNQEEFCVAFRKGDPLCDIFTAALKELSADGQISRLSAQYLGTDYTCMEALPGALQLLETQPEPGRKLRIGVQDGIAPISSSRDDGSFGGKAEWTRKSARSGTTTIFPPALRRSPPGTATPW